MTLSSLCVSVNVISRLLYHLNNSAAVSISFNLAPFLIILFKWFVLGSPSVFSFILLFRVMWLLSFTCSCNWHHSCHHIIHPYSCHFTPLLMCLSCGEVDHVNYVRCKAVMHLPDQIYDSRFCLWVCCFTLKGPTACRIHGVRESQTPSTFLISVKTDGPGATRGKVCK